MAKKKNKTPEVIEDADLDAAGGTMLLPAVQKVREAAATTSSDTPAFDPAFVGGVNVAT